MAVLEAVMPRIERKLDDHMEASRRHATVADAARKELHDAIQDVKDAMAKVKEALEARENQAKGFTVAWEAARSLAVFIAGILGLKWFGLLR